MEVFLAFLVKGLRHFFHDVYRLMNPAQLVSCFRPYFFQNSPESHGFVTYGKLRRNCQASCLQIKEKFAPALGTFSIVIKKTYQFLFPFRGGSNNDEHALFIILHAGLEVNAVIPYVDIVPAIQPSLVPVIGFFLPLLTQTQDRILGDAHGILAQQKR